MHNKLSASCKSKWDTVQCAAHGVLPSHWMSEVLNAAGPCAACHFRLRVTIEQNSHIRYQTMCDSDCTAISMHFDQLRVVVCHIQYDCGSYSATKHSYTPCFMWRYTLSTMSRNFMHHNTRLSVLYIQITYVYLVGIVQTRGLGTNGNMYCCTFFIRVNVNLRYDRIDIFKSQSLIKNYDGQ